MSTVLVTGARAPVAVHLARLLHAAGHRVLLADTQRHPLGRYTRAAEGYVRLPPPRDNLPAYAAAVQATVDRHGVDLVVPTCEEVFFLAAARDLPGYALPLLSPGFELLAKVHHKGRFAEMARGFGADPPRSETVSSAEALAAIPDASERVLKPAWSRFASRVLVRPTAEQMAGIVPTPSDPWVVQDYLPGEEICAYAVARDGHLLAVSAYRPLYRAGLGAGVAFEPLEDRVAEDFIAGFVRAQGWSGQISFDFRRDAGGQLHVIECNPRATSGLHFFGAADGLADAIVTGRPARPTDRRPMTVPLAMLVYGLPQAVRLRRVPTWLADARRFGNVLDFPGDSALGLAQLLALAEIATLALRTGQSLQQAATRDIEWNGEALGRDGHTAME